MNAFAHVAIDGPAGTAASRKLCRSVFYKGMAAAVTESLRAGVAAGCESWLRENIAGAGLSLPAEELAELNGIA